MKTAVAQFYCAHLAEIEALGGLRGPIRHLTDVSKQRGRAGGAERAKPAA